MAQDKAPAAFYTDWSALPQKPGGAHRPTDVSHGSWARSNLQWLSLRRSPHRVGVNRMLLERRIPEEAKAWGNAQDRLTSGRWAERESGESEATSQNAGSQEPDGGLAREVLSQSCYFESLGVCKPLNSRHPIFGFCPKIELCDRAAG
jgi:hypothetical protein